MLHLIFTIAIILAKNPFKCINKDVDDFIFLLVA